MTNIIIPANNWWAVFSDRGVEALVCRETKRWGQVGMIADGRSIVTVNEVGDHIGYVWARSREEAERRAEVKRAQGAFALPDSKRMGGKVYD